MNEQAAKEITSAIVRALGEATSDEELVQRCVEVGHCVGVALATVVAVQAGGEGLTADEVAEASAELVRAVELGTDAGIEEATTEAA